MVTRTPLISLVAALIPLTADHAASEETYTVVFEATWSASTHPDDFPPGPHFSGLIGGTHTGAVSFWAPGQTPSEGIERMAETGAKIVLTNEIEAAITAGDAEFVISGGGIGISPGSVSEDFTVTQAFPLVSLVSMLAPSPDWFVGVSALPLYDGGAWVDETTIDLYVYDAGSDAGTTYTAPNTDTNPKLPIELHDYGPFASNGLVGTFTFTRQAVGAPAPAPSAGLRLLAPRPNPSRGPASITYQLVEPGDVRLDVIDVAGRLVRRLVHGTRPAGAGVVRWDGTNTSGARAPAGVYLVRLETAGETRAVRVVRIR